jgi:hypothetical protein
MPITGDSYILIYVSRERFSMKDTRSYPFSIRDSKWAAGLTKKARKIWSTSTMNRNCQISNNPVDQEN